MAETPPPDWADLADRLDALADDLIAAAEAGEASEDDAEMVTLWARGMKHYAIQLRQGSED